MPDTANRDFTPVGVSKLRGEILKWGGPQYLLAAMCGMAPSRLSEYVLMQRQIAPHHLMKLCRELQCNPEDITGVDKNAEL